MNSKLSLILSVYKNDNVDHFVESVNSCLDQIIVPNEIIIVVDGPVGNELNVQIKNFDKYKGIQALYLQKNVGRGLAKHTAILHSKNEIVAIMDSDDICLKNRFSTQLDFLNKNINVDIVGSYISEFKKIPGDTDKIRKVPLNHDSIVKASKFKVATNHVSIMFKKSTYLKCGGYNKYRSSEDVDFLGRMVYFGARFANIPEILIYVRFPENYWQKRSGFNYLKEELIVYHKFFKRKQITFFELSINVIIRVILRLSPLFLLKLFYNNFMRTKIKKS